MTCHHDTVNFTLLSFSNKKMPPVVTASERHVHESAGGKPLRIGASCYMATGKLVAAQKAEEEDSTGALCV